MHNYGSAPGELAACLTHVGLVERPGLAAVRASADPGVLDAVTLDGTGRMLAVGGAARAAGTWWCRPGINTVLLIDAPRALDRTLKLLAAQARRHPTFVVHDERLAVLGVIGRRTPELLAELGVCSDPRAARPCSTVALDATSTTWLLESDVSALCCVTPGEIDAAQLAIATAGRSLELARVGQEALTHFLLMQRRRTLEALR